MDDPRIPKPRGLPKSLAPKVEEPKPEPPPKVGDDLVRYLRRHFPEKAYVPEEVTTERVWFDHGTRVLAMHLIALADKQVER